jgi:hypothetical protein
MPGIVQLHYQVRSYLLQNPQVIPYDHVVEVLLYGGVVPYVVGLGVDTTTEYGQATLTWHQALYDVCRDICDTGRGHFPYQPFPPQHGDAEAHMEAGNPPFGVHEEDIAVPEQEDNPPAAAPPDPLPDIKPCHTTGGNEYVEPTEEVAPVIDVEAEAVSGVIITVVKTSSFDK